MSRTAPVSLLFGLALTLLSALPAGANTPMRRYLVLDRTDYVIAGAGGVSAPVALGGGSGTLNVAGVSGTVKLAATRGYGAEVVEYDRSETTREELGAEISRKRGLAIIPPYDHPDIIAGQGTTAKELFEEVGILDGGGDFVVARGPLTEVEEAAAIAAEGKVLVVDEDNVAAGRTEECFRHCSTRTPMALSIETSSHRT